MVLKVYVSNFKLDTNKLTNQSGGDAAINDVNPLLFKKYIKVLLTWLLRYQLHIPVSEAF